jgi:beta-lactamase superfamily II metal-dependent hydrolase
MRLQIFDVGHGFCALLVGDNGNVALFDCGHDEFFRPSIYLPSIAVTAVEKFVVTNFDGDHVSDLANLRARIPISTIWRNPTIPADTLRRLKLQGGPLTTGLAAVIDMHGSYNGPIVVASDFAGVTFQHFHNPYPTFTDTNNLSLVTFVDYVGLRIVIPGDLECDGWLALLRDPNFRAALAGVDIFVASHHGRESGYCKEAMALCTPGVVIISDTAIQYNTQNDCYAQHASGLNWSDGSTRKVLTTRCDGHITISKAPGQSGYSIQTRKGVPPQ